MLEASELQSSKCDIDFTLWEMCILGLDPLNKQLIISEMRIQALSHYYRSFGSTNKHKLPRCRCTSDLGTTLWVIA